MKLIAICVSLLSFGAVQSAPLMFRSLSPELSGVDFEHPFMVDHPRAYLYHSGFAVGAICLGDVNGDGHLDLFLVSGPGENRLFLGSDGMRFEERTPEVLKGGEAWGSGAAMADLDNDGDLDLYQCNYDAANQVFLNDGKGGFRELAGAAGLGVRDASLGPSFADVDGDGDLDLFLLCNRYYDPNGRPARPPFEMVEGKPRITPEYDRHYRIIPEGGGRYRVDDYGRADYLFLNDGPDEAGNPRFRDVSRASGLRRIGYGLSSVWWDYDRDGDLDLYVANDFLDPDRLFRNDGVDESGVPVFADVVAEHLPSVSWSSMGSDSGDVNNDGRPDLLTLDMSATTHFKAKLNMGEMGGIQRRVLETGWPRQAMRNHLFVGTGTAMFQETARAAGLASSDWSWTAKFGDLDNDGWEDVFVTNGMSRNFTDSDREVADMNQSRIGRTLWDFEKDGPPMPEENFVYRNTGGQRFERKTEWGLGLLGMSYSAAMGDLDNDGDLDLVVSDLGKKTKIYENRGAGGGSLQVILEGTQSNRMGVGAEVALTDRQGTVRTRWQHPWRGFLGQHDSTLHFGLGDSAPASVTVVWPSGVRQTVEVPAGTRRLVVREAGVAPKNLPPKEVPANFELADGSHGVDFRHAERVFDDFARQPLLPAKHSQLGPCLAAGDVDADGDEDLFVGGAAGQAGALFLNDAGRFHRSVQEGFGPAAASEDLGAAWFDADGDGDLDLYVVSGGVEGDPGSGVYRDRLYLSMPGGGAGPVLVPASAEALPKLADSGSCVTAADYDGDGDVDVFVGTRLRVGEYPLGGPSRLLRNDSGPDGVRFTEVTEAIAPGLAEAGLVTGARFADLDADGDADLCVAVEWGAIKVYLNDGSMLREATGEVFAEQRVGWWNDVVPVDVDQDGDLDLVAGNVGWNTKYGRPKDGKLAEIFYGDMDGSGRKRIVEAKHAEDCLYPVRGRSCSSNAMPSLKTKFPTFRQFALSELDAIYAPSVLQKAHHLTANAFESGVWINQGPEDGAPRYEWLDFPWEAQLSPVNAVVGRDFDGDGRMELVLAQNNFTREPETGLWRGNPGCHLEWNGTGFTVIPHVESGVLLPHDTKALVMMDVDGDGAPDLVAGQNDDEVRVFLNRANRGK